MVINLGELLIRNDFFTLFNTEVTRVSIYDFIIFPDKLCCYIDVVNIR